MSCEPGLTRRQEELLLRYADGECGLLARRRAEALIRRNDAAREFVREMRDVAKQTRVALESELAAHEPDLWMNVSLRIAQEERSAAFLGRREPEKAALPPGVIWGLSGAAVAAGVTALVLLQQPASPILASSPAPAPSLYARAAGVAPSVSLVAHQMPLHYQRPRVLEDDAPVEVDWLRSEGRVRMISAPGKRSAIIWINRNRGALDRYGRGTGPSEIRMIDDSAPVAVQVSK